MLLLFLVMYFKNEFVFLGRDHGYVGVACVGGVSGL